MDARVDGSRFYAHVTTSKAPLIQLLQRCTLRMGSMNGKHVDFTNSSIAAAW